MRFFARQRIHIVAIAAVAILINALAPAISAATIRSDGQRAPWLEVCTTDGVRRIDSNDRSEQKQGSIDVGHKCLYCSTHAGTYLHVASPRLAVASAGHCVVPRFTSLAPVERSLLADHSARAPPQLS